MKMNSRPRWQRYVAYVHNDWTVRGAVSVPQLAAETAAIDGFGVAQRALYTYMEDGNNAQMEMRSALLISCALRRLCRVNLTLADFDGDGILKRRK